LAYILIARKVYGKEVVLTQLVISLRYNQACDDMLMLVVKPEPAGEKHTGGRRRGSGQCYASTQQHFKSCGFIMWVGIENYYTSLNSVSDQFEGFAVRQGWVGGWGRGPKVCDWNL
jgi:hypothetical protein